MQLMKSTDYFLAVKEMQELAGSRLDNVYDEANGFRLRFRKAGNEFNVLAEPGVRLHLARFFHSPPATQSSFVQLLRRELENAKLEEVKQINSDRIILFAFVASSKSRSLVFEQFGKGNVLLLDESLKVIRPLRSIELGGRQLRKGAAYSPPAASSGSKKFEEEIQSLEEKNLQPVAYYENNSPIAFSAVPLPQFSSLQQKTFPSFSEALDDYYNNFVELKQAAPRTDLHKQLAKLRHSLAEQKKRLAELIAEELQATRAGELIYENYALIERELENAMKKGEKLVALEL